MSVATAVYDQTCHVCEAIKNHLLKFYYNIQRGKQLSANRHIYEVHMKADRDREYHFSRMNEYTNNEYDKKIKKLWDKPYRYDATHGL